MKLTGTKIQIEKASRLISETRADVEKAIAKGNTHRWEEDIEKLKAIDSMDKIDSSRLVHSFYSTLPSMGKMTWEELFK